jgi:hypothetical protein
MPVRSVVPFRALGDTRLSSADLRLLVTLGGYGGMTGQDIDVGTATLMRMARLERRTFFRCLQRLVACGYVVARRRYDSLGGQLPTVYDVVHDAPWVPPVSPPAPEPMPVVEEPETEPETGPPDDGPPPDDLLSPVTPRPTVRLPGRAKLEPTPGEAEVVRRIWRIFPPRTEPKHNFVRSRRAIVALLREGADAEALEEAAEVYAAQCAAARTEPKFVISMHRFYDEDGTWTEYRRPVTVDGMTRAQWIRARLDAAEFDRRAGAPDAVAPDPLDVPGLDL